MDKKQIDADAMMMEVNRCFCYYDGCEQETDAVAAMMDVNRKQMLLVRWENRKQMLLVR